MIDATDGVTTVVVSELGVSEVDVVELEQELDEIDRCSGSRGTAGAGLTGANRLTVHDGLGTT